MLLVDGKLAICPLCWNSNPTKGLENPNRAECPYCGAFRVRRAGDHLQCTNCEERFVRLLPDAGGM